MEQAERDAETCISWSPVGAESPCHRNLFDALASCDVDSPPAVPTPIHTERRRMRTEDSQGWSSGYCPPSNLHATSCLPMRLSFNVPLPVESRETSASAPSSDLSELNKKTSPFKRAKSGPARREVDAFLSQIKKIQRASLDETSKRWNFDFESEAPCQGRWEWQHKANSD
eukprot:jgi/Mesvir1/20979/Mv08045-RA.1